MVDTINFSIRNLEKYQVAYNQFYLPLRGKDTVTQAYIDYNTGEYIEDKKIIGAVFHDNQKFLPITHRGSINIPSHDYNVRYNIFEKDCTKHLAFEFSIPKYLYGTNIFQFMGSFDFGCEDRFTRLYDFVRDFLRVNVNEPVNPYDVVINRLDLCYNQYFNCKQDAIDYLDAIKEKHKKNTRPENRPVSWQSTCQYVTDKYSFKVYHKGPEFVKHDLKKLQNHNPKGYDLNFFQSEADRILRYEATVRHSQLTYLYDYNFFDRFDPPAPVLSTNAYAFGRSLRSVGTRHDFLKKYINQYRYYGLSSIFDKTKSMAAIWASEPRQVTFDYAFYSCIEDFFWKKIGDWSVTSVSPLPVILEKIKAVNDKMQVVKNAGLVHGSSSRHKRSRISVARLLVPALLSQYYDIRMLKSYLPKTTFEELLADLKLAGIETKTSSIDIPKPSFDFNEYYISMAKYL